MPCQAACCRHVALAQAAMRPTQQRSNALLRFVVPRNIKRTPPWWPSSRQKHDPTWSPRWPMAVQDGTPPGGPVQQQEEGEQFGRAFNTSSCRCSREALVAPWTLPLRVKKASGCNASSEEVSGQRQSRRLQLQGRCRSCSRTCGAICVFSCAPASTATMLALHLAGWFSHALHAHTLKPTSSPCPTPGGSPSG